MFITFEGLDCSGKSTAIEEIKKYVKANDLEEKFIFTREPGGTGLKEAESIRNLILSNEYDIDPMSEALLYLVSRKIHLTKIIEPALADDKIVICDRFVDSSLAYQGAGRNLGIQKIKDLNDMVTNKIKANITFFFRIPPQLVLKRLENNRKTLDRLEREDLNFYEKIAKGYETIIKNDQKRFIIIDGTMEIDKVMEKVIEEFKKIINKKNKL